MIKHTQTISVGFNIFLRIIIYEIYLGWGACSDIIR